MYYVNAYLCLFMRRCRRRGPQQNQYIFSNWQNSSNHVHKWRGRLWFFLYNISPVLQRLTRNLPAPSAARGQLDIRFHSQTCLILSWTLPRHRAVVIVLFQTVWRHHGGAETTRLTMQLEWPLYRHISAARDLRRSGFCCPRSQNVGRIACWRQASSHSHLASINR